MTPLLSCRASEALRRACPVLDTGESMKQMQKEKEVVISRAIWSFIARKSKESGMKKINTVFLLFITTFILITLMISVGECATVQTKETKDEISNLSFSYDGKKVLFDRCRDEGCQIQVYDLETGELAAYQSPANERWTMAKQSYDGKKIVFSVIPEGEKYLDLTQMQIAVMDVDGKNYKKLTSDPLPKIYPTFSHSGKKILYVKAGRIRKQGRTPASDYDAWEVDIETGKETRLTKFEYMYMSSVCYFPDDERFLYQAEGPFAFPGLDFHKDAEGRFQDVKAALAMIGEEAHKRKIHLVGTLVMKRGDLFPQSPYVFDEFNPKRPLLSKDGTRLFVEAAGESGKFYLYSPDGNHRLVHHAGSVDSVAISPDGALLGICRNDSIFVMRVSDDAYYRGIFLRRFKDWDDKVLKMPYLRLLSEKPLRIINR